MPSARISLRSCTKQTDGWRTAWSRCSTRRPEDDVNRENAEARDIEACEIDQWRRLKDSRERGKDSRFFGEKTLVLICR